VANILHARADLRIRQQRHSEAEADARKSVALHHRLHGDKHPETAWAKAIVVITTLLDPVETTKDDLAALYRARWNNELDLRSIKSTMQMDILRCKTPELVHKEVWTHILAYNLIRTIMAQTATNHGIEPRTISFKGTLQTLEAFRPLLDFQGRRDATFRAILYQQLLDAVALHRVANRPDRFEPRYRKRRSKRYAELKSPRHEAKHAKLKGDSKN
jgi:hypothetical protein